MEPLIYLSVFEYEIWICNSKNIVNIEVNLNTRSLFNEFQNRHSARRNIYQCSLFCNFAYNLTAHFNQLMMIMCQWIKEDRCYIDIRFLRIPWTIMATAKSRYENLSSDLDRVILVTSRIECFLYPIDYLIPDFQIFLRDLLVLVHFLYQLLDVLELLLCFLARKVYCHLLMYVH